MSILPTHRDDSPSGASIAHAPSSSSDSTHISRTPTIHNGEKTDLSGSHYNDEKGRSAADPVSDTSSLEDEKGYDDKGIVEVEEDGVKRKVRVVLEHKTGRELLKEVQGGEYTTPRWRHSLPFIKPKHGPPPAPLSLDNAPVTPEVNASFISFLFFNWISPLMALGSARPLQATDLWRMDDARSAGVLSEKLMANFERRQKEAAEYNARLLDPNTRLPLKQRVKLMFASDRKAKEKEYREKTGKKEADLAWALSDTFGLYFWAAGLIKIAADLSQAFTPLVIRAIIKWATEYDIARRTGAPRPNQGHAVGMAVGLLAMLSFASVCNHHFFLRSMGTGVLLRSAIISAVYKRALCLTQKSRGEIPNGKIVNHISTDVSRIDFAAGFFHISWTAPIQFIVISIILLVEIGYSALPGLGFLLMAMPIQTVIMKKLFAQRKKSMIWTDKRAKLLQEILGGMRIVKFMAWEIPFLNRLRAIRKMELYYVRKLLWIRSGMMAFAMSLPVLAAILAFITYSLTSHGLSAATVFTVLTLFQLIRMPLMIWPMALSSAVDAHNGLKRLSAVFEAEVMTDKRVIDPTMEDGVRIENASFTWDAAPVVEDAAIKKLKGKHAAAITGQKQVPEDSKKAKKEKKAKKAKSQQDAADLAKADINGSPAKLAEAGKAGPMGGGEPDNAPGLESGEKPSGQRIFKLKDITLNVPKGSLTAIVGPIGSGKSSLLQGLMGEMRRTEGKVVFSGSTALCAQTPWIQNATIRENILFGQPWDEERYWAAVRYSCLEADLELLEDGDGTEIGEKGINLSGGQKQRVNIARAVYYNADIIALDDPLSALDAGVGKALFFNAILGALAGKTRILVTHALHFLPYVDNIVLMDEGRIVEQGTYNELRARMDGAFARLIKDFGSEDHREAQDETEEIAIEKALPQKVYRREDMIARVDAQKLMSTEERKTGTMTASTYLAYFKAGKGAITIPFLIFAVAFYQGFFVMTSFWLVYWQERKWDLHNGVYIAIYAGLGIGSAMATFFMGFSNSIMCIFASTSLFNGAIKRVMFAPQAFFDTTPLGRIMNRFSKDMDTVDNTLSDAMRMLMGTLGGIIGSTILISIVQPYFLVAMAFVTLLYIQNARFYRKSSIEFKRIDAILRSSLYSHFSESLSGIATIRSYGESERFCKDNVHRMDVENRAYYPTIINQRWLGIRLDILGSVLSFVVAIIVVTSHNISPAKGGLAMSTMITVQQSYSWLVRQIAEVENDMVGAERIMYYANTLEQESDHVIEAAKPQGQWPSEGRIEFKNVRMKYREELPDVLKGLTLSIGKHEKIGVVGRTGAGKSSIMMALFRMSELSGGAIEIDGVDLAKIGLNDLRSGVSIIPQDPLLFSGTLRTNIDPFNEKTDAELYDALRRAHLVRTSGRPSTDGLSSPVDDNGRKFTLDTPIEEEGGNLSVGERSLVSLARALVRDSKILVLDEATASVDVATDAKIQETIRAEFREKTLLCIAHRLRTILSYDRILVMADGRVEEFDTPENLYNQGGAFYEMCEKSSISLDDIKAATALRF